MNSAIGEDFARIAICFFSLSRQACVELIRLHSEINLPDGFRGKSEFDFSAYFSYSAASLIKTYQAGIFDLDCNDSTSEIFNDFIHRLDCEMVWGVSSEWEILEDGEGGAISRLRDDASRLVAVTGLNNVDFHVFFSFDDLINIDDFVRGANLDC